MYKVLIVDDSTYMRKSLRQMLEKSGYEVIGEDANGKNIVRHYEELEPDVITLDLDMPQVDGITALETLIPAHPEAKVVVVSAQGHKDKVLHAIKLGAKSYLVKPIEPTKLAEVISAVLNEKNEEETKG